MDDAIENRVRKRGFTDDVVPCLDGNLAGDDGRFGGAVVDEFQQVLPLGLRQRCHAKVIQNQQIKPGDLHQPFAEATFSVRQLHFFQKPCCANVEHGQALAARLIAQRTGQPGFAAAGDSGEDQILRLSNPFATDQAGQHSLIQPASGTVVDVLHAGVMF